MPVTVVHAILIVFECMYAFCTFVYAYNIAFLRVSWARVLVRMCVFLWFTSYAFMCVRVLVYTCACVREYVRVIFFV